MLHGWEVAPSRAQQKAGPHLPVCPPLGPLAWLPWGPLPWPHRRRQLAPSVTEAALPSQILFPEAEAPGRLLVHVPLEAGLAAWGLGAWAATLRLALPLASAPCPSRTVEKVPRGP